MRKQLSFKPEWDGVVEKWCCAYIHKHLWRVTPFYDFDDLYQDAYLYFMICCERYARVVEAPHFMSLVKTCLRNHVNDLALSRKGYYTASYVADADDEIQPVVPTVDGDQGASRLLLDLESRWPTVFAYVTGLLSDSEYRARECPAEAPAGRRETGNQKMARIAGLDASKHDVRGIIDQFLHEGVFALT